MDPAFEAMFPIFVTTLGPFKVIPVFNSLTGTAPLRYRAELAARAAIEASVIVGFVVLVTGETMQDWQISPDAIGMAGGIILFLAALRTIADFSSHPMPVAGNNVPLTWMGWPTLSPLAVPVIVTPGAVAAILFFLARAGENSAARTDVVIMLALMMLANLIGMLLAKPIMKVIRLTPLRVIGWIFAVLQAGLAVQAILNVAQRLHLAP
jgi:multiple antibiotic resistance protein